MWKDKKGFISTTIIYSFFLVFIMMMIAILMSYTNKAFLKSKIVNNIYDPGENPDPPAPDPGEPSYPMFICKQNETHLSDCLFYAEANEVRKIFYYVSHSGVEGNYIEAAKTALGTSTSVYAYYATNYYSSLVQNELPSLDKIKTRINDKGTYGGTLDSWNINRTNMGTNETREVGLYAANDGSTSYYYRGAEKDNYLVFDNKLWSIVRINGDGSIRIIYQGDWDTIKTKSENERKNYIKNYGYIDVNMNGSLDSNDARHYNIDRSGDSKCNYFKWAHEQNKIQKKIFCDSNHPDWYLWNEYCSNNVADLAKYGTASANCGNKDYSGATSLWNIGFLKAGSIETKENAKLQNNEPSDAYMFLSIWYGKELSDKSSYIEKTAYFNANKDIVYREDHNGLLESDPSNIYSKYSNQLDESLINAGLFGQNIWTLKGKYCTSSSGGGAVYPSVASMPSTISLASEFGGGDCNTKFSNSNYDRNYNGSTDINYLTSSSVLLLTAGINSLSGPNDGGISKIQLKDASVGLLSSTELSLSGMAFRRKNEAAYLSSNYSYWLSDLAFGNNNDAGSSKKAYYFIWNGEDSKKYFTVQDDNPKNNVAYLKPVINLKSSVKYKDGDGSIMNPYTIVET